MQYYFCPRCKFRMIAARKHICPTCGYKLPRTDNAANNAASEGEGVRRHSTNAPSLWSKIFKWEFDTADNDSIESPQEKPVLS